MVEIIGGTAVVRLVAAVGLPAAPPEVKGGGIPSAAVQGADDSQDVYGSRTSLQAVADQSQARGSCPRQVEIQEIPVRRIHPPSMVSHAFYPPEQGGYEGLKVTVGKDRGGVIA
jgi:hypothetical protein